MSIYRLPQELGSEHFKIKLNKTSKIFKKIDVGSKIWLLGVLEERNKENVCAGLNLIPSGCCCNWFLKNEMLDFKTSEI